jgi:protein phosphatase
MNKAIYIDCHGRTDVGKERGKNEDAFLIAGLSKAMTIQQTSLSMDDQTQLIGGMQGQLFVVADGIGGHAAGDRASSLSIRTVTSYVLNTMSWFFNLDKGYEDDLKEQLSVALKRCRDSLVSDIAQHPKHKSMGTTLTMAYMLWPKLYVVHAGDSRCYVMRDRKIYRITRDHTVAQRLVDEGAMDSQQAEESRMSDVVWNVISADRSADLDPDVYAAELLVGDVLLLCTDGLTKHLSDEDIAHILTSEETAECAASRFIEKANDDGGSDNTTVVVARFLENEDKHEA